MGSSRWAPRALKYDIEQGFVMVPRRLRLPATGKDGPSLPGIAAVAAQRHSRVQGARGRGGRGARAGARAAV